MIIVFLNISFLDSQDKTEGSLIIETYEKLHSDKQKANDGYATLSMTYAQSVFYDFGSYL